MKINAHSVYMPREHIIFLEEWLLYHMWSGVDHFYLYDNTGSWGDALSLHKNVDKTGKDKRGYNVKSITSHLTDNDIHHIQEKIFKKYTDLVTRVKWQPRHRKFKQRIIYGQSAAIHDYVSRYGDTADWTYFFDIDEFFYSPMKKTLRECIIELEEASYSRLVIFGNNFLNRYKLDGNGDTVIRNKYQSQIFESLGRDPACPKQIIRCRDLAETNAWRKPTGKSLPAIHYANLKPGCKTRRGSRPRNAYTFRNTPQGTEVEYARFNHYNTPEELITESTATYGPWGRGRHADLKKHFPNGIEDIYYDDGLSDIKPKLDKINMVINEYIDIS